MPFAMIFIGLLLVVTGLRDTHAEFGRELVTDVGGKGGFGTRMLAIGAVGAIGYIGPDWRRLSVVFMFLVLLALLFSTDAGFFAGLSKARVQGPAAVEAAPAQTPVMASNAGAPKGEGSSTSYAGIGSIVGATVGSIIPGAGTVIGGALGSAVGGMIK
jgi:hypothetical protein